MGEQFEAASCEAPSVMLPRTSTFAALALVPALAGCAAEAALPPKPPVAAPAMDAAGDTAAQAKRRAALAATKAEVQTLLQAEVAKRKLPNLAFGLLFNGRLVYFVGLGERAPGGGAVTEDTVFRIGSITKTFTGAALLQLRDAGRISLDDPLAKWVPDFARVVYPSADSGVVTIRHLVTHTSGIPRLGGLEYADGHAVSYAEILQVLPGLEIEFAPGSMSKYSNLAMALAGLVVARASGEKYRDYVTHHLLDPLGMRSTVWDREAVPPARLAQAYKEVEGAFVPADPHWRLGAAEAMGGLYSSTADMARYAAFQLSAWPPRDGADTGPLKRSSLRESQLVAGFGRASKEGFGVNWIVRNEPGIGHVVFHNGGTEGYHSSLWMVPERSIAVIALGPGTFDLDTISRNTLDLVAKADKPILALGDPARAALDRVKALLDKPDGDAVEKAFTPAFVRELTRDKLVAFFESLKGKLGKCTTERIVKADGRVDAEVELSCEKGTAVVRLSAEGGPPHRLTYLTIRSK